MRPDLELDRQKWVYTRVGPDEGLADLADFLVSQGVDRTRVEVKGIGPDQPLPGRTATSEANRRVEAVLLS